MPSATSVFSHPTPLLAGCTDEYSDRAFLEIERELDLADLDEADFPRGIRPTYQPPLQPEEEIFRHWPWKIKRNKVITAMEAAGCAPTTILRLIDCGSGALIYCEIGTGEIRVCANYCRCRHCAPCQRARAARLARNLQDRLSKRPSGAYRFITLTLAHSHDSLKDQIDRLYASFRKLRKDPVWADTQNGGVAICEVKWSAKTRQWHPHLHIVSEGKWVKQQALSDAWLRATGDSYIVDIKILKAAKDCAHYLSKYVTKGTSDEVWDDLPAAVEWITATKGLRNANTFGSWRGFRLMAAPPKKGEWKCVGTLVQVVNLARQGAPHAQRWMRQLLDKCRYDPHRPRRTRSIPSS